MIENDHHDDPTEVFLFILSRVKDIKETIHFKSHLTLSQTQSGDKNPTACLQLMRF